MRRMSVYFQAVLRSSLQPLRKNTAWDFCMTQRTVSPTRDCCCAYRSREKVPQRGSPPKTPSTTNTSYIAIKKLKITIIMVIIIVILRGNKTINRARLIV